MRAAVLVAQKQPLSIQEVATPKIGNNQVLVKVKVCGICHTDISLMTDYPLRKLPPLILGHEIAGDIEQAPEGSIFKKGDRVLVRWTVTCRECDYCRDGRENLCEKIKAIGIDLDGGFAEFVLVPLDNILRIPENLSYETGALAAEAVGTPYKAVKKAQIQSGTTVAIFGAGGLGIPATNILSELRGAKVIAVDILEDKLEFAKSYGADFVVNGSTVDPIEKIKELTGGKGVDVAFEFVGRKESMENAVRSVRKGGKVMIVGATATPFSVNPFRVFREEVEISGSYGSAKKDVSELLDLFSRGRLKTDGLISGRCKLDEINEQVEKIRTEKNVIRSLVSM